MNSILPVIALSRRKHQHSERVEQLRALGQALLQETCYNRPWTPQQGGLAWRHRRLLRAGKRPRLLRRGCRTLFHGGLAWKHRL